MLRSRGGQAAFAYLIAFLSTRFAQYALVLLAGVRLASGRPTLVESEARRFALSASGLMACAFVAALVLVAIAAVTARLQGVRAIDGLRLGPSRASGIGVAAAALAMIGLSLACGAAIELAGVREGGVLETISLAFRSPTPGRFVMALMTLGLAPAVAEETFFRGLLQTQLSGTFGPRPAVVIASAAFGFIHVDPVQGSVAFFAGLLLGWVAERFGSVRPGVAAHFANNVLFVSLAAIASPTADSAHTQAWVLAGGTLMCAASVAALCSPAARARAKSSSGP
jgi:membrane protease YdiL (CAAX protease family)